MIHQPPRDPASLTPVVVYDATCGLCRCSVSAIIRHDRRATFRFVPLASPAARALLEPLGIDPLRTDTVVLIENGRLFTHSTAVLRICRRLAFPMWLIWLGWIVPWSLRDELYNLVSRNRHHLSKLLPACHPEKTEPQRFLIQAPPPAPR